MRSAKVIQRENNSKGREMGCPRKSEMSRVKVDKHLPKLYYVAHLQDRGAEATHLSSPFLTVPTTVHIAQSPATAEIYTRRLAERASESSEVKVLYIFRTAYHN